ncbi:MAG: KUP/HAK/KT family potassium transporter [Alphaproteobacteria bacterium]|nr:KUP/HAK/KT family potassium transporter [Alphaproteobacteria bacterium]MCB9696349.1 KUP/HAK/KT family potassium transporter [Alphaproteobacteria bacterium]
MDHTPSTRRAAALLHLAALGVVYGDIGTSPLYTWNEIRRTGVLASPSDVIGAASLLVWTLTLAISVKYAWLVLRADNRGEGGTFALAGLLRPSSFHGKALLMGALTFAACLLYADGLLTPAISVVSAMEGLAVASPVLEPLVVPAALAILAGLFAAQKHGTARLGTVFGTVCVAWFATIGVLGLRSVAAHPQILAALLPHHAVRFLFDHLGGDLAPILGAVVLAITGGEAMYADIGHFGVGVVRRIWFALVYPALTLSYLGQGAALWAAPERQVDAFYALVPSWMVVPMVVLAAAAAIIASQALVSGAFSLTRSAIHLGLVPRLEVLHTSETMEGQIYVPTINAALWFGCSALVLGFRSSAGLAEAYGLAVMGVVVTTTVACALVARHLWGWSATAVAAVFVPLLAFDTAYLLANVHKIPDGAWVPLACAGVLYAGMALFRDGRRRLREAFERLEPVAMGDWLRRRAELARLDRSFVFLVSVPVLRAKDPAPLLLRKFVERYGALPTHLTLFTVVEEEEAPYWRGNRFEVVRFEPGVVSVAMHVGFMERADVRAALAWLRQHRHVEPLSHRWTVVTGQEELVFEPGVSLRLRLAAYLMRLAGEAWRWFGLDADTNVSREVLPVRVAADGTMHVAVPAHARPPRSLEPAALGASS